MVPEEDACSEQLLLGAALTLLHQIMMSAAIALVQVVNVCELGCKLVAACTRGLESEGQSKLSNLTQAAKGVCV